jgi:polyhydroxyalkanoate synthesis regulator phasin
MFQIAGKFLGTTKNADQVYRDRVRKDLQKVGFLNQQDKTDYTVKFSDGAVFDLGKDGNAKLINADGKGERKYREIDFTNPLAQTGLNHTNGLAHLVTAGVPDKKGTKYDYAGYFTNAVTEGAKDEGMIKGRAKELYTKAGFDSIEKADAAYDAMVEAGRISKEEAAAFKQEARSVGLASEAKPAEEQQRQTQFRLPEDTPISKKRLNSRFDTGFTARPVANDVSTGVSQYLSMVDQMAKRRQ